MNDVGNSSQIPGTLDRPTERPFGVPADAGWDSREQADGSCGELSGDSAEAQQTRVLHIINGEDYAGAERVQDLLAATLPQFGYRVGFACVKLKKFGQLRRYREAALYDASTRSPLGLFSSWKLSRLVRQHQYALIHAHTPRSAIVGYWLAHLTGLPFVYHVHSPASHDSTRRLQNWVNARAEGMFLSSARKLITVSQSLCEHMVGQGYRREQISVVPNGVPIVENPLTRPAPTGPWTLGMVALFRPRKGTEILLEALRILKNRGINAQLRCVGSFQSTEYETQVKDLVNRLGLEQSVTWTGYCSDVNGQLREMDALVLPSLFGEGLPMVVLEAMAAGVPVVATRVEGVPEAIRDKIDGLIAEPSDPRSLADVLQQLMQGTYAVEDLRRSARERQVAAFSNLSMARAIAGVYDEILGR